MKFFVIMSFTFLLIAGCRYNNHLPPQNKTDSLQQNSVSHHEEPSEHSPSITEVSAAQLDKIDSVVNGIDGDKFLYKMTDSAIINKNIGRSLKYEVMYKGKNSKPVKIISMIGKESNVALITYYLNGNLIMIEGSINKKDGKPDRTFAYYDQDKAIYFSGNINRKATEIMKNQSYFVLNNIKKHDK